MIKHITGLFVHPHATWLAIQAHPLALRQVVTMVALMALIPAIAGYLGTTMVGWRIGTGDTVRLTTASAGMIAVLYYLALILAVLFLGWMIQWMSQTYTASQPLAVCIALATYVAVPLFLAGAASIYPILWLDLVLGLPALAYSIFLLYSGLPVVMGIEAERGFLFASAILAVGLVGLVGILALTVVLWSFGLQPVFTNA